MEHKKYNVFKWVASFLSIALLYACKEKISVTPEAGKPNIVFLYTDDQSYNTVAALGNSEISTPTLDGLMANGTTFTHAYNMGGWNGAICLASRAMIISGRSIWRAQKVSQEFSNGEAFDKTWPRLLKEAGYETYMTGKWHISAPADSIFDHVARTLRGMPFDTPEGYDRPKSVNDTLWKPWDISNGGYWQGGKHWSELVRDDAIQFLGEASEKDVPFFMYVAFNAPHDPRQSPKKYVDRYPIANIDLPESFLPEYPYNDAMGAGRELRDERLAPFPRTPYAVKVNKQEYYAITTHLDDQIGLILEELKDKGLHENTYIFLTSDHGLSVGEHGLMGKQNMYDHSIRVPLMIVGPDVPKGKKVGSDVYLQDIMPSVLEIGGVEKPSYVDFNSLLPLIWDTTEEEGYNAIYGCYEKGSQRMIRKDGYKLIVYPKAQKVRLYDLENDPMELNDISDKPEHLNKVKHLFAELIKLQVQMEDELRLTTNDYAIFK